MNFYQSTAHVYEARDEKTGKVTIKRSNIAAFAMQQNRFQVTYENPNHKLSAGASTDKSLAAKCIISEQGGSTSTIKWRFLHFNMWTLTGEVEDGVIE